MNPARITRHSMLCILATLIATLTGCSHYSSPSAEGVFGASTTTSESLRAKDAYPNTKRSARFAVIGSGDDAKGWVEVSITSVSEGDRWEVAYRKKNANDPFRLDVYSIHDGDVVMIETTEYDRDALTTYDPPLIVMPGRLRPGSPFEQKVAMTVHPPKDRSAVRRKGEAHQRIELIGQQVVKTGSDSIEALHVKCEFNAKLSPAEVATVTERWYSTEHSPVGFIAERYDESLKIMGVPSSSRGHLWLLRP